MDVSIPQTVDNRLLADSLAEGKRINELIENPSKEAIQRRLQRHGPKQMWRWRHRLRNVLLHGGSRTFEITASALKAATRVLRLQTCFAERVTVRSHDLHHLMCPAGTTALESLSIENVGTLEEDFTAIFESGDAELYEDQLLEIKFFDRTLREKGPLRSRRAYEKVNSPSAKQTTISSSNK